MTGRLAAASSLVLAVAVVSPKATAAGLGVVVRPIVDAIAGESMTRTLDSLRQTDARQGVVATEVDQRAWARVSRPRRDGVNP
jgi:hypothetical protein